MDSLEIMPIRTRVTSILRKALLSGEFASGSELSLTEIAARLGVSRTPVREAFQTLAAEGLLELRMNKGAIVLGIDEKFIEDHFDMRILLEGEAAARVAKNGGDISTLIELQEKAENNTLPEAAYLQYNQDLHTSIWKMANNDKLYSYLSNLWNGPSIGDVDTSFEHYQKSIQEHRQILTWIEKQDPEQARSAMKAHIERSKNNILKSFRTHHS